MMFFSSWHKPSCRWPWSQVSRSLGFSTGSYVIASFSSLARSSVVWMRKVPGSEPQDWPPGCRICWGCTVSERELTYHKDAIVCHRTYRHRRRRRRHQWCHHQDRGHRHYVLRHFLFFLHLLWIIKFFYICIICIVVVVVLNVSLYRQEIQFLIFVKVSNWWSVRLYTTSIPFGSIEELIHMMFVKNECIQRLFRSVQ